MKKVYILTTKFTESLKTYIDRFCIHKNSCFIYKENNDFEKNYNKTKTRFIICEKGTSIPFLFYGDGKLDYTTDFNYFVEIDYWGDINSSIMYELKKILNQDYEKFFIDYNEEKSNEKVLQEFFNDFVRQDKKYKDKYPIQPRIYRINNQEETKSVLNDIACSMEKIIMEKIKDTDEYFDYMFLNNPISSKDEATFFCGRKRIKDKNLSILENPLIVENIYFRVKSHFRKNSKAYKYIDFLKFSLRFESIIYDKKTNAIFVKRKEPTTPISPIKLSRFRNRELERTEITEKKEIFDINNKLLENYNPKLINTDMDLDELTKSIKDIGKINFTMCLYGEPGTGKSLYARYLAKQLGLNICYKRASDLLSKWVGDSEKNISRAFREAKEKKAMLIIDEADSFFQKRDNSIRSWEVTQVNEMLTQMEYFEYPFICTTNLLESLDEASLRRFVFKVKFDFMNDEQVNLALKDFFGFENTNEKISGLTPGDFKTVKRILEFLSDKSLENVVNMLKKEAKLKQTKELKNKVGF